MRDLYGLASYYKQFESKLELFIRNDLFSYWHIAGQSASCGFLSPFAGIYRFSDGMMENNVDKLQGYFRSLVSTFREEFEVNSFRIRLPPNGIYKFEVNSLRESLQSTAFGLYYSEIDHFIAIGDSPHKNMRRDRRRELILGQELYVFRQVNELSDWKYAVELLQENRFRKGITPTFSFEKISLLAKLNPKRILVFLCEGQDDPRSQKAAAICQVLDSRTVYTYLWGHTKPKENLTKTSPMTFLADNLINFFTESNFKHLYLGSSSTEGRIDLGLCEFKDSLGALRTQKEIWSLTDN